MLKKAIICFLVFFSTVSLMAGQRMVKTDSLVKIIQLTDKHTRESHLVFYIEAHFYGLPLKNLDSAQAGTRKILYSSNIEDKLAYQYLIESICQERLSHKNESENLLIMALDYARKEEDHHLLTVLLINLAYRQTEDGYATGAIESYRLAKKEAKKMEDGYLQLAIDNNISDVYYKNNYYLQALNYLSQADSVISVQKKINKQIQADAPKLEAIIDYNKAEIFFRKNEPDSLKVYCEKLQKATARYYKLFTFQNRTRCYLYLLNHDYLNAIQLINSIKKNVAYKFDDRDLQNLADAYFNNNNTDSATFYVNKLLKDPAEANYPDVKLHLYDLLGQIAEKKDNYLKGTFGFKTALKQAEAYNYKLTQLGSVSSLIKIDEIENANNQKDEEFERERLWLVFAIVVAFFTMITTVIIYRNVKQKRHYETLLHIKTKSELSFMNSHEVRKHLTNILGLIDVIGQSDNKGKAYLEAEDYLFNSVKYLDNALKSMSEKLDE